LDDPHAAGRTLGTAWAAVDFHRVGLTFRLAIITFLVSFLLSGHPAGFDTDLLSARAIGQNAVVADLHESASQHVQKETSNGLRPLEVVL
jgi:hypothetical protein